MASIPGWMGVTRKAEFSTVAPIARTYETANACLVSDGKPRAGQRSQFGRVYGGRDGLVGVGLVHGLSPNFVGGILGGWVYGW